MESWLNQFDPHEEGNSPYDLYVIGEGVGESIVLNFPSDFTMIVDCFGGSESSPTLNLLRALKIKKVDLLLLTHLHFDHYAGLKVLLDNLEVDSFGHTYTSNWAKIVALAQMYELKFEEDVKRKNRLVSLIESIANKRKTSWANDPVNRYKHYGNGSLISSKEYGKNNFKIDCVGPLADLFDERFYTKIDTHCRKAEMSELKYFTGDFVKEYKKQINDSSLLTRIIYGKTMSFLTGDSENKTLKHFNHSNMEKQGDLKDVRSILVKIPHHGSNTSDSEIFFNPKLIDGKSLYAVVTPNDNHDLPELSVIEKYLSAGYRVFRTSKISIAEDERSLGVGNPSGIIRFRIFPSGDIRPSTFGNAEEILNVST